MGPRRRLFSNQPVSSHRAPPPKRRVYGGTAGQPYDACYHQPCDTPSNVNKTVLDQMADAIAYATFTLASTP